MTVLWNLQAKEAVGASPVDIARAYMRTRVSEVGTPSRRIISEEERSLLQSDGFASPLMPSRSPKSSVCWPGAMVQDQHDYSTPQSSRYGLHHFQRTPYSRTMYSKSKPEVFGTSWFLCYGGVIYAQYIVISVLLLHSCNIFFFFS